MGSTLEDEVVADWVHLVAPYSAFTECCDDGSEAHIPLLEEFEEEDEPLLPFAPPEIHHNTPNFLAIQVLMDQNANGTPVFPVISALDTTPVLQSSTVLYSAPYILYYKRRAYIFSTLLYPVLILETALILETVLIFFNQYIHKEQEEIHAEYHPCRIDAGEAPAPRIKTFLFSVAGNRAFPGIYSL